MSETDRTRSPDWRWQAAIQAVDNPYALHESDVLSRHVVTCLRQQRRARTSSMRARVQERFPTIMASQRIRFNASDGRREAIEVRVLAGYGPEDIAELCALDPAVVWTYLALFFDVLDRIDSEDFIWTQVVGFQRNDDGEQGLQRRAMLWLSWVGGPLVASFLLLPGRNAGLAEREEEIGDHLMATTKALITRATALAPFLSRLDREQARQFTRWRVQASQQQEADIGDRRRNDYLDNVRAFLDGIELSVGRSTIPKGDNEKYFTGPIEPRASELCAIARGSQTEPN